MRRGEGDAAHADGVSAGPVERPGASRGHGGQQRPHDALLHTSAGRRTSHGAAGVAFMSGIRPGALGLVAGRGRLGGMRCRLRRGDGRSQRRRQRHEQEHEHHDATNGLHAGAL